MDYFISIHCAYFVCLYSDTKEQDNLMRSVHCMHRPMHTVAAEPNIVRISRVYCLLLMMDQRRVSWYMRFWTGRRAMCCSASQRRDLLYLHALVTRVGKEMTMRMRTYTFTVVFVKRTFVPVVVVVTCRNNGISRCETDNFSRYVFINQM